MNGALAIGGVAHGTFIGVPPEHMFARVVRKLDIPVASNPEKLSGPGYDAYRSELVIHPSGRRRQYVWRWEKLSDDEFLAKLDIFIRYNK